MTETRKKSTTTLTPEELAALIREGIAAERQNTFFRRNVKPILSGLWRSRLAWLIVGALLMLPFVSAENPFKKLNRFNPAKILKADSPAQIAKDAPNDPAKRQAVAAAYRSTSNLIREKAITSKPDVLASLTVQTADVLSSPAWKTTVDRIDRFIRNENDLESLADKLHTLATEFTPR